MHFHSTMHLFTVFLVWQAGTKLSGELTTGKVVSLKTCTVASGVPAVPDTVPHVHSR